jgi:hypothetical protein
MLRKLITLTIISPCMAVNAQSDKELPKRFQQEHASRHTLMNQILHQYSPGELRHKGTAIKQRVKAQAIHSSGAIDSTVYFYEGINGSYYDYNRVFGFGYSTSFNPLYAPALASIHYRPSTDIHASRIVNYHNGSTVSDAYGFYNGLALLDSAYLDNITDEYSETTRINYNDEGRLLRFESTYLEESFMFKELRKISYNELGKIATDTTTYAVGTEPEVLLYSMNYSYNEDGMIDTVLSVDNEGLVTGYALTYYDDKKLRTVKSYEVVGDSWALFSVDSLGFTAGIEYLTYAESKYLSGATVVTGSKMIQVPNSEGRPDSVMTYIIGGGDWQPTSSVHFTYNSFGNPSLIEFKNNSGIVTTMYLYYDEFDNLSSNELDVNSQFVNIYPNPFTDEISVDFKRLAPERVLIKLVDITGKIVYKETGSTINPHKTISVSHLNAGLYILNVENAAGERYSQKLIKQ